MQHKQSCKKKEGIFRLQSLNSRIKQIAKSNLSIRSVMICPQPNKNKKGKLKNYSIHLRKIKSKICNSSKECSVANFSFKKRRCSTLKWHIRSKRTNTKHLLQCFRRNTIDRSCKFENGTQNKPTNNTRGLKNSKILIYRIKYAQMWNFLIC